MIRGEAATTLEGTVSEDGLGWSVNYWAITLLTIMNSIIAVVHINRTETGDVRLTLVVLLLAVFVIWAATTTMRKVLREVGAQLTALQLRKVRINASAIALMSNCAIASALHFVR